MDKLPELQRASIAKMSDERIRSKLVKAGYRPEILAQYSRTELMNALAELVAAQPEVEVVEEDVEVDGKARGTMTTEERRLLLEERKLQMEEKRWKAEMEEKRREMEIKERELERQREKERREMEFKERELDLKRIAAEKEESYRNSTAARLKLWGDGLRNTISRMPNEPIEVVSWFVALEKLFEQLEVPDELRAVLLRPYLNDRAKALLARCDLDKTGDYSAIKEYLLREMRLSPSVYLEKFNSMTRDASETFQQFATRLMSLFDFYLESRKVNGSYNKLFDLIIYDKIKSVLPPFLSRHVLTLESAAENRWLGRHDLVDALDAFIANMPSDVKAKSVDVTGFSGKGAALNSGFNKPRNVAKPSTVTVENQEEKGSKSPGLTPKTPPRRRCFRCGSSLHLISRCPERNRAAGGVQTSGSRDAARDRAGASAAQVNRCQLARELQPDSLESVGACGDRPATSVSADCSKQLATPRHSAVAQAIESDESAAVDSILADGWSQLQYIDIEIQGVPHQLSALYDSGTQLCCVDAVVIQHLNLPILGHVMLKGLTAELVRANLVCLYVKLSDGNTFLPITCAVCNNLNSPMLLGTDVVHRLNAHLLSEQADSSDNADDDSDLTENVVSQVNVNEVDRNDDDIDANDDSDDVVNVDDAVNKSDDCAGLSSGTTDTDERNVAASTLITEQQNDKSLDVCRALAQRGRAGYYFRDGILYRRDRLLGQEYEQLCLPNTRRAQALKLAHSVYGGHLASKKTKARLKLTFTWPTLAADVRKFCETCHECQKRRRVTVYDRTPIVPVPRDDNVFQCFVMDCLGPLFPNQKVKYNYALVVCDSCSRFPFAFALTSLTAKNVCNALLQLFQITGIPSVIRSDMASNFNCELTRTFLSMLGCTPRFNVPGRPQQTGLCERLIGTLKNMVSKVATDHPKSWHQQLGYVLWALRECPNETTGVPPWVLVFGKLPRGPLAVLKEEWTGQRDPPLSFGQTTTEYLEELRKNLEVAETYVSSHAEQAQQKYVSRYNLRAREKSFSVGDSVLVLYPDSTSSKVFSKWRGPGIVREIVSKHSYIVELDGVQKHMHADKLRKYHVQVDEVLCDPTVCNVIEATVSQCAIIYEDDKDFGDVAVVDPPKSDADDSLPSQKIDPAKLAHLSDEQRNELLAILDQYHECFSDQPGFCDLMQHEIHVTENFKPKRLRAYRVPESLKPEVERQIREMLDLGIIEPSTSEMASPIVCVLKGKHGKEGVRLAVDYRYLNKHCLGDAYPLPNIDDVIQRIGKGNYISTFDVKGAYWQLGVRPDHQWLTAFIWDGGLYQFTRAPFGQKGSGCTFVRVIQQILHPLKEFTDSYVDDISVFSDLWRHHLSHLEKFLMTIKKSGLTLNLKKCSFAQKEVRFLGHIIGSGQRRPDPDKIATVHEMKPPESKKQVRQVLGFFAFFRDYIPNFAATAKPLTDLTRKRVPNRVPWGEDQECAFQTLKSQLCEATTKGLNVVDFKRPFTLHVDASEYNVGAVLTQTDNNGKEQPVAFASSKLNETQRAWSVIEKETFAAIWALKKYRNWIFGKSVTVYTDHNPVTYLTETAPKSAKLMRYALALQEYDVIFRYKAGKNNAAADCLSRL